MRVLVTGGTGFVGSHLVDVLLDRGFEVVCTVRPSSNLRWLGDARIRRETTDFSDPRSLARALDGVGVVFHVAGVIQAPDEAGFMRGNRDLTRSLIRACAGRKLKRFVHVSSLAAAGPSRDNVKRTEASPCKPISAYGRSKLAGEHEAAALADHVPLTVVRPPVVYGPRDTGLLDLFKVVRTGILPIIGARKLISLIHIRDLVRGILDATFEAGPDTWFLTNPEPRTWEELVETAGRALGAGCARIHVPDWVVRSLADLVALSGFRSMFSPDKAKELTQRAWICSGERARERLGFVADTPVGDGFRETAAWYRSENWL